MTKYCGKKIAECEAWIAAHGLMDYGGANLKDYCKAMSINDTTHRSWLQRKEYVAAIERGVEVFKSTHTKKLFTTLMEAALGGERTIEEENSEFRPDANGNPQIHRMLRHKRKAYQKPDTVAAIFLLCNIDPEHWRQRQDNNIAFKKPDNGNEMSLDEIKDEIKRLTED